MPRCCVATAVAFLMVVGGLRPALAAKPKAKAKPTPAASDEDDGNAQDKGNARDKGGAQDKGNTHDKSGAATAATPGAPAPASPAVPGGKSAGGSSDDDGDDASGDGEPETPSAVPGAAAEYRRQELIIEAAYNEADYQAAKRSHSAPEGEPLWWQTARGVRHDEIDEGDFYRRVGRNDLASRFRARRVTRQILVVGGIAAMLGGVLVFFRNPGLGLGLMIGGPVLAVSGRLMSSHPVGYDDAASLADAYNSGLHARLGLTPLTTQADERGESDVPPGILARFRRESLGVDITFVFNSQYSLTPDRRWSFARGESEISAERFYKLVGRPDLASRYGTRAAVRVMAVVGSVILIVGGAYAAYSRFASEAADSSRTAMTWGMLGVPLGVAGLMIANDVDPNPVSEGDAREMADRYNRNLLRSYGIDVASDGGPRAVVAGASSPSSPRGPGASPPRGPRLGFGLVPGGAGVGLSGQF